MKAASQNGAAINPPKIEKTTNLSKKIRLSLVFSLLKSLKNKTKKYNATNIQIINPIYQEVNKLYANPNGYNHKCFLSFR